MMIRNFQVLELIFYYLESIMEPKRQKLDLEIVDETNCDAWNFNDFPNEIIEKIFSYLTQNQLGQIARVCKKWNVMTKSPVLWKKVDVEFFSSYDKEWDTQLLKSFIDGLPSCVTFIRLDFSDQGCMDFEELCMKLHQKCPEVEVLILKCCRMSTSLSEIINSCTQFLQSLKKLVLHDFKFNYCSSAAELKDNSKIEVLDLNSSRFSYTSKMQFSKLRSLKELRLASTRVNDACFVGDTFFLNHLQALDLRRTFVTTSTFRAIQRHGQNLKELYLCHLRLDDDDFSFTGLAFPLLQAICLICTLVTGEGLVSLVQFCPSLVSVYVNQDVARSFSEHPFVVANRCKSGIVKSIDFPHNHDVDYSHN